MQEAVLVRRHFLRFLVPRMVRSRQLAVPVSMTWAWRGVDQGFTGLAGGLGKRPSWGTFRLPSTARVRTGGLVPFHGKDVVSPLSLAIVASALVLPVVPGGCR